MESRPRLVSQVHHLTHQVETDVIISDRIVITLSLLQIQLFFLECQNQQCGPVDYSHFPGYARFPI